jgi:predicted anti-sigma-YlaC factor YlaD
MLSAQLDGEDDPAGRPLVEEHLAGCAGCREWLEQAATVNRLTRTGVLGAVPDLSAAILAALPPTPPAVPRKAPRWALPRPMRAVEPAQPPVGTRRPRVATWLNPARFARPSWLTRGRVALGLYLGLAVVGAVQLILGLGQVGGGASSEHVHAGLDASAGHLWHESAAWNVAVGAAYLFIALRRHRPSGLVPMLTAFVAMLLVLSVNDLTADRVDGTRLVSHGFVILGYLLVVALSRVVPGSALPPGARAGEPERHSGVDGDLTETAPLRPGLRLVPRGPMTAGHDEDRRAA